MLLIYAECVFSHFVQENVRLCPAMSVDKEENVKYENFWAEFGTAGGDALRLTSAARVPLSFELMWQMITWFY